MARRILILAGDTDGNLGDLAIVTATCETLRCVDPEVRITLVTSMESRDCERLDITPIRRGWRGLIALCNAANKSDLVIFGGGGLLQDDDSLIKLPYWAVRLACIRLFARRIVGLSVGAGPLKYKCSRFFARLILRMVQPMTVRDQLARSVLVGLSRHEISVVPDPAFLLDTVPEDVAQKVLADAGVPVTSTPLIGVAARRWFHKSSDLIPHKYAHNTRRRKLRGNREMAIFTTCLADVLDKAVERLGCHIIFMPTYNVEHEADIEVCKTIAAKMRSHKVSYLSIDDPKIYKAITGQLNVMLCGRMHAAILAAALGTPVIGLAYNPKFVGTFALFGQQHRCIDLETFVGTQDSDALSDMLLEAISSPEEFRPDTGDLERRTARFIEGLLAGTPKAGAPSGPDSTVRRQ